MTCFSCILPHSIYNIDSIVLEKPVCVCNQICTFSDNLSLKRKSRTHLILNNSSWALQEQAITWTSASQKSMSGDQRLGIETFAPISVSSFLAYKNKQKKIGGWKNPSSSDTV